MRLVQFTTEDELRLNGLVCDVGSKTTVIHVHGKCGNFYENKFVKIMFDQFPAAGINFLSFNNRGTACFTEAVRSGGVAYIGTAVEDLSECVLDLRAAISFARTFSQRVVLQGHSFGCEKITLFAKANSADVELILLSPSDGYRLQQVYIAPESVEEQLTRMKSRHPSSEMDWLSPKEYGIRVPGVEYHVPITASALVRLIEGPAFSLLRCDKKWVGEKIENPCLAYVGGDDPLQVDGAEAMLETVRDRYSNAELLFVRDGRHDLGPDQAAIVERLAAWINRPQHSVGE